MKKYQTPELDVYAIMNGDILTESPAEESSAVEGPIVDIEDGVWNW